MAALYSTVLALLILASSTAVARAGHVEPAKANKATFGLVNAYFPCDVPNTATSGNALSACAPAVPNNACQLTASGSGKLTMSKIGSVTESNQDLKISVVAKGLNAACEGDQLEIILSYRLTTDDCPEGSCTGVDVHDIQLFAPCVVTGGKCKISTTLNTAAPGLITTMGKNAGLVILGCGLKPVFPLVSQPTLECGVLLK